MENLDRMNEDVIDKVKVFSSDGDKLKVLGELLSNKTSRDIIKLLIDKEMYANEIAQKLELRRNLVIHHLKKLAELGLLEIKNKKIVKKGNMHKYYKMIPNLFVAPNLTEEKIKEKRIFKRIFQNGVKIAVISFGCLASWFSAVQNNVQEIPLEPHRSSEGDLVVIPWSSASEPSSNFFLIPIIIIGCSLFLIWFSRKTK